MRRDENTFLVVFNLTVFFKYFKFKKIIKPLFSKFVKLQFITDVSTDSYLPTYLHIFISALV
jgi:hypothetical protein